MYSSEVIINATSKGRSRILPYMVVTLYTEEGGGRKSVSVDGHNMLLYFGPVLAIYSYYNFVNKIAIEASS